MSSAALRILDAMETEGSHRRALEKQGLDANVEGMCRQFAEARPGQIFAFSITVLFVLVGAYVALHGQPWSGTVLGSLGLGGIVTAFLARRREQNEETETPHAPEEPNTDTRK